MFKEIAQDILAQNGIEVSKTTAWKIAREFMKAIVTLALTEGVVRFAKIGSFKKAHRSGVIHLPSAKGKTYDYDTVVFKKTKTA